ncbi:MAG: type II secretion system F family protein [Candidatus Micrarchaeota archaeon]
MFKKLFIILSFAFPKSLVAVCNQLLIEADFDMHVRQYLGASILISTLAGISMFFIAASLLGSTLIGLAVFPLSIAIVEGLFFMFLYITADNRAKKIEEVLPDALFMISANIRAGMTTENAVMASAKPEFGPLEEEIRRMSAKTFGGLSLNQALTEMSMRIRSTSLRRAVRLLVEGNSLGGQMASLLYEVGQDLRNTSSLKRELMNITLMYTIFIIFSCVIASPLLFATSVYYTQLSDTISSRVSIDEADLPAGAMSMGNVGGTKDEENQITGEDMQNFAVACIVTTTFFSSLVLSEIRHGRINAALKYAPVFVTTALVIFFLSQWMLKTMFKTIMAV